MDKAAIDSSAWPMVCPKFNIFRSPVSRKSDSMILCLMLLPLLTSLSQLISKSCGVKFPNSSQSNSSPTRACLLNSIQPLSNSRLGNVFSQDVSIATFDGFVNVPIAFFMPLKLMPFFPPMAASTIPSRVVGMRMKFRPLLYVDATKAPRSVVVPPPIMMRVSNLEAFTESSHRQISCALCKDLHASPAMTQWTWDWLNSSVYAVGIGKDSKAASLMTKRLGSPCMCCNSAEGLYRYRLFDMCVKGAVNLVDSPG